MGVHGIVADMPNYDIIIRPIIMTTGNYDLSKMEERQREQMEKTISEFGQTPIQLLTQVSTEDLQCNCIILDVLCTTYKYYLLCTGTSLNMSLYVSYGGHSINDNGSGFMSVGEA